MSVTNRLVFDPTDANSIAASSSIGGYVLAGDDGTPIGHVSDALKVDIGSVTDLDIRDLTHVSDSVKLGDGTTLYTGTTNGADHGLDVNMINASIAVTATDLDIRDLAFATDSVTAHQGGTWTIDSITNDVTVDAVDLDIRDLAHATDSVKLGDGTTLYTGTTNGADHGLDVNLINTSIAVTATDLDIRDLSAAQDSVESWLADGAGTALTSTLIGSDQALDVNLVGGDIDDDLADTAIENFSTAVSTTAVSIGTTLANRKYVCLANEGNKALFFGKSGVTAANGFPLYPGMQQVWRIGPSVAAQVIGGAGASAEDMRVMQLS